MARNTYTRATQRRRNARRNTSASWLIIFGAIVLIGGYWLLNRDEQRRKIEAQGSLTYVVSPEGLAEEMIEYKGFTVSFNPELHIPNWVAWELTGEEVNGTAPRHDRFSADEPIAGCATPADYTSSGYDRGHMAPAGDMKWDEAAMAETFYMTNIAPQAGRLNKGAWKKLEEKCRQRAVSDSAIIIVCGPVPGEQPAEFIGRTGVAVPRRFFKVVLSPYANPPRAIGFIMNNGNVAGGMQAAAMSVDEVERVTGYDFFSALPDDVEAELESQINFNQWSRLQ